MPITKITIENFKGISERVEIPIAPITLLFGANSAGKSSILQALLYMQEFSAELTRQRPYLRIPPDVRIHFIRWKQLDAGEKLHARYILTDIGGIGYDYGLDEGDPGESTDVQCLAADIYRQRWQQYHPEAGYFELVDAWAVTNSQVFEVEWVDGKFVPSPRPAS